jgi:CRISPR-associated protein Cas5t
MVWRVKSMPLGAIGNTRPDYQQLLTSLVLVIWLDSADEKQEEETLEQRVTVALESPHRIQRYGGLSLGESSHLVDEVRRFKEDTQRQGQVFLLAYRGRLTLPVWVDHVGSSGTRHVIGDLELAPLVAPSPDAMPQIAP